MQSTGKVSKQVVRLLLNSLGKKWFMFAKITKDFGLDVKELLSRAMVE